MHLREAGSGRPILLLHGWTCHGGFFQPQFAGLAGRAHLLAPDLPGHGLTGNRAAPLTVEHAADLCQALLTTRDLRGVVAVGWSMGAAVAWALAERHGTGRLAGLVTIDMTPKVLNDAGWSLGTRDGLDAARNARVVAAMPTSWPRYAERVARTIFAEGREPPEGLTDWVRQEAARCDPAAMAAMWRSLVAQDFRALLPRLDLPCLVVSGARSQLYREEVAAWQVAALPTARLARFEASGHAPHLEEPEAFNAVLGGFLDRL